MRDCRLADDLISSPADCRVTVDCLEPMPIAFTSAMWMLHSVLSFHLLCQDCRVRSVLKNVYRGAQRWDVHQLI